MVKGDSEQKIISILYVEDDPESSENLSEIIRHRYPDIRLLRSDNGNSGLEMFKQYRPEIVITDINMPILDGIKMASAIKALSPATEIIALTAYTDTKYLLQAIELGFSHYILKPVDIKQLYRVMDKTVSQVRSEQEKERQNDLIRSLNAELVQKKTELEMSIQDLESFSYTVAHDLRSPMVNVSGVARLLFDRHAAKLDNECKEYLESINQEMIRMSALVDVLLKFSVETQKHPQKSVTSLTDLANEVKDDLMLQNSGRKVEFCIADGINAFCDPNLMRIVLGNLLGNAWKYSAARANARIEFGMLDTNEDLVYFVRDNGSGFAMQEAENLFIPFHRLLCNENVEGFGIGLATVRRIIQRHGGRIWAEGADKGDGAIFFFTL